MHNVLKVSKNTNPSDLKNAVMAEIKKGGFAMIDAIGTNCQYIASKAFVMARGHAMCYGADLTTKLSFVNLRIDDDPTQIKTGIRWKITIEGDKSLLEAL